MAKTRLTLENSQPGFLDATLEMDLGEGQRMLFALQIPKRDGSRTIRETEREVLQHAQKLIEHMLQQ